MVKFLTARRKRNKLNKIAGFFLALRLLKTSIKSFKWFTVRARKFKQVRSKHAWLVGSKCIKEWYQLKTLYVRLNKLELRNAVALKFDAFTRMKINWATRKVMKKRIKTGLDKYHSRLLRQALRSLLQYRIFN